jgi:hypothetical protein
LPDPCTPKREHLIALQPLTTPRRRRIDFRDADAHGLNLGQAIGTNTWNKAQTYLQGSATG